MAQLFNRYNVAYAGKPRVDEKGKPFYTAPHKCARCGGRGKSEAWAYTGYTCYDCGGAGNTGHDDVIKLYTAEELAKLNATAAKRLATKNAKLDAERKIAADKAEAQRAGFMAQHGALLARCKVVLEAQHNDFIADVVDRAERRAELTEGQANALTAACDRFDARQAERAASQHVGNVGDRITLDIEVVNVYQFEQACFGASWKTEIKQITTMRDSNGNCIVAKSTTFRPAKGVRLIIKATVKAHTEYKGQLQTEVQRMKVQ